MHKVTIELPDTVMIRNIDGAAFNIETAKLTAAVIAGAFVTGTKVIFTNCYNGGGRDATDAERKAAVEKKRDAWYRGDLNIVERGESQYTAMKDAFIDEFRAANGNCTIKAAEGFIRDTIAEALGKDAKATFSNYLDCVAQQVVSTGAFESIGEAREALEAHYTKLADDAAKSRAKVSAKLVAPKLDLASFKRK